MLVYVALALARGLRPAARRWARRLGGIALGVTLISAYALATRLFPDRLDTYDDPDRAVSTGGAARILELARAAGVDRRSSRARLRCARPALVDRACGRCRGTSDHGDDAVLHVLARRVGSAHAIGFVGGARVRTRGGCGCSGSATVVAMPVAAVQSRTRLASTRSRHEDAPRRAAAARWASRCGGRLRCDRSVRQGARVGSTCTSPGALPSRGALGRAFDVALAGLGVVLRVGSRLVAAGGPSRALDGLQGRGSTPSPPCGPGRPQRAPLQHLGQRHGASSFASPGLQGASVRSSATARARSSTCGTSGDPTVSSFATPTRCTWRRSPSSASSGSAARRGAALLPSLAAIRARRQRFAACGTWRAISPGRAAAAFDWHWEMVGVTHDRASRRSSRALVAAERGRAPSSSGGALVRRRSRQGLRLSVFAVWSLVGNQALFAGREALARRDWAAAREHGRRAEACSFWSAEPESSSATPLPGSVTARQHCRSYRKATTIDPTELGRVAPPRAGGARPGTGRGLPRGAQAEPPRRGTSGRVTFRNRLALALLAPSEREPTGDETAADDDDAEERETGVRKRVLCRSGRRGVAAGRCRRPSRP